MTAASTYRNWSRPLSHSSAALDLFPTKLWVRLLRECLDVLPSSILGYGDPAGYRPLRQAIADYLGRTRGIGVSSEQIIVVSGSQQALDVAARALFDPGDHVLVEDPGYLGARAALTAAGAVLRPVSVDAEGLNLGSLQASQRRARGAYVTPSHHFPLGATMSLPRRLALLEWAQNSDAWILEDDYDGEYRYTGGPLSPLAGLDSDGRVVYIGTFSKLLFPALRLGYMVVPEELAGRVAASRAVLDRHSPTLDQATLAAFIEQGHFARHVRRMRLIYAERRTALITALRTRAEGLLEVDVPENGMYVIAWLRQDVDDCAVAAVVAREGIAATPLSTYCIRTPQRGALLLGFAGASPGKIDASVRRIGKLLRRL